MWNNDLSVLKDLYIKGNSFYIFQSICQKIKIFLYLFPNYLEFSICLLNFYSSFLILLQFLSKFLQFHCLHFLTFYCNLHSSYKPNRNHPLVIYYGVVYYSFTHFWFNVEQGCNIEQNWIIEYFFDSGCTKKSIDRV